MGGSNYSVDQLSSQPILEQCGFPIELANQGPFKYTST